MIPKETFDAVTLAVAEAKGYQAYLQSRNVKDSNKALRSFQAGVAWERSQGPYAIQIAKLTAEVAHYQSILNE